MNLSYVKPKKNIQEDKNMCSLIEEVVIRYNISEIP